MKKYRLGMIMAVFAFIAMLPLRATAAETKEVGVTCTPTNDSKTEYSMELYIPNVAKEEIATLSLKLDVNVDASAPGNGFNDPVVNFSKDVTSKAKVYETRYHSTLNIYIAGVEALFGTGDTLNIGTVSMSTVSGEPVALSGVTLSDDEDAIMVVRGWGDAEAVATENWVQNPDEPGGPDIPENPDTESKSEFTMPDSNVAVISKEDASVIEKSALAYVKANYGALLGELGEDYKVISRLDVSDWSEADVPQDVKDAFAARLNGMKVGKYYDISIYADIVRKNGEVVESGADIPITELESEIRMSLSIPEELRKDKRVYQMFHCRADLMAEGLASEVKDGVISFRSKSFSPYALAYTDKAENAGGGASPDNGTTSRARSARTGDAANVTLYLILALVSGGAVVIARKKRTVYR